MHAAPLTVDRPEVVRKESSGSFLDGFLISFLAGFLVVSPWYYGLVRFRDQLVAECILFGIFLICFPFLARRRMLRPSRNEVDFWVVSSGGVALIYTAFSALPYQSLLAFFKLLGLIVFYSLVRSVLKTDQRLRAFLWTFLASGFFYAAYGLAQYYGFLPHAYWSQPFDLASRFVNGGHFAAFLLFPLWMGISLFASSRNWLVRLILVIPLGTLVWALILTRSRTGWGVILMGLVTFFLQANRRRLMKPWNSWTFPLCLLGILAGMFLFTKVGGVELILNRTQELWRNKFYSLTNRVDLWRSALLAIQEHPWGWGLGTFGWIFPQYKVQTDRFVVDYAHNEFLQTGVDLGIPGFFFLTAFLFFYLKRIFSLSGKEELSSSQRLIGAGLASLFVCLVIASQVDFPLRIYANGLYFSTSLALSAYLLEAAWKKGQSSGSVSFKWISFLLVFPMTFLSTRQLLAEIRFEKAQALDQDFKWNEALVQYRRSVALVPFYGRYQEGLGNLYYRKTALSFQKNDKMKFREEAIRAYQKAIQAFPYNAHTHHLLGLLLEEKGDIVEAKAHFKEALRLDPQNGFFLSEYANFAFRQSLVKEALIAFDKLMRLSFRGEGNETVCSILKKCYQLTRDYRQVQGIAPDDEEGHLCLGYVLGEYGKWDLAQAEFDRAIEYAGLASKDVAEQTRQRIHHFYISNDITDERYGEPPTSL